MTPQRDPKHQEPDERRTGPTRRGVVGAAGLVPLGGLALSGCGGSDGNGASPATPSATRPVDVAATSEVPVGGAVTVDRDGVQAVVGQPEPGEFAAFSPVCPHQGCLVTPREQHYVCPCHDSVFDLATGDVQQGPATTGLTRYPATVRDGRVVVG